MSKKFNLTKDCVTNHRIYKATFSCPECNNLFKAITLEPGTCPNCNHSYTWEKMDPNDNLYAISWSKTVEFTEDEKNELAEDANIQGLKEFKRETVEDDLFKLSGISCNDIFDGVSIEDAIKDLQDIKSKALEVGIFQDSMILNVDYNLDGYVDITLVGERYITDEEIEAEKRLEQKEIQAKELRKKSKEVINSLEDTDLQKFMNKFIPTY